MQQKKKLSRKVISYVLALVMVFSTLTGIVPGMSITAYAESYHKSDVCLSGEHRLADVGVGTVISKNCTIYKNSGKGITIYDTDGTTVLVSKGTDGWQRFNAGCDIIILTSPGGIGTYTAKKCFICSFTSAPTAKENLIADGNEQDLIEISNDNVVTGGTMCYQLGESSSQVPTGEWKPTAPKGIDAGQYYVWYKVEATEDNYADYPARCITTEIKHIHDFTYTTTASGDTITATCKEDNCPLDDGNGNHTATLTIAVPLHTTYGDDKEAVAVITDSNSIQGDATVTYYNAAKSDDSYTKTGSALTGAPTDAGDYVAEITLGTGANTATASIGYTIAKADPTVTAPTGLTATYGQTLANVSLEGKNPEGNTPGTWAWVDETTSVGSVGDHTFVANYTPTDTANYNSKDNVDVTVTVGKAANPAKVTNTATVTKGENTVDLESNVTLNGATGTVSYEISGGANGCTLSGSVLTSGNDTGSVTVNVTVAEDGNYDALATTPITVTISDKGTQTITASDVTATYGDTNKKVEATTNGGGAISYAVKSGSEDYIDVDNATGALVIKKVGTATVIVTAAETATYAQATKEVTVTISKANAVAATVTANNRTYDGNDKPLVTVDKSTLVGGEMQYALGTETEATQSYTTSIPTATSTGTYYVWYKVNGDANHNNTEPDFVEAKINPVDMADLNKAIKEVGDYYNTIKDNPVYSEQATALSDAIKAATALADNKNAKDTDVSAGITAITEAKKKAEAGVKDVDDTAAAKKVTDVINALPASSKVATTDKAAIEAARKAYDALTADQKKKVSADTLKKLTDAETALTAAEKKAAEEEAAKKKEEADTKAANAVVETINKLPVSNKVATTDKAAIEAARKAYDALSADQKKKVSADTLKKLTDAETALTAAEKKATEDKAAAEKKAAEEKAAKELAAAKQEAQAAMNEQVTVTQKGRSFTVKWKKTESADGYYVYASYCGKKATKPAKTIKKNTTTKTTITKINGKKINQKKNFHVYVVPYKIIDGKNVILGKSTVAHVVGAKNAKYSNVKKLTLTKSKYTVKVGKTAKIKAKVTLVNKNKKHIPKSHGAKFRYKSSDAGIATVDKNGKIKGIKKGTCTIYVYSINGLVKKAKVTVQ